MSEVETKVSKERLNYASELLSGKQKAERDFDKKIEEVALKNIRAANEISSETLKSSKRYDRKSKGIVYLIVKNGITSWILLLAIWQLASMHYSDYFLPGPLSVIKGFEELISKGVLVTDIIASVKRAGQGWLLGILLAVPLGLIIGNFEKVRWLAEPFLNFFRFVPVLALTSLFLMWFGVGEESKIALITYATFFPMLINTIAGVGATNKILIEAAQCMGASRLRVFLTVIVPSSIPFVFTGVRLGLSGSILCVVAAEMLVANNGLGYLVYSSRLYYNTGWMFVGIITLGVLGFAADRIITYLGKRFLKQFGVK